MRFWNEKLRALRKEKDMSIETLAELSGVSKDIIKNMENGRRGTKEENVLALSVVLGVDIEDLYKRDCIVITALSHKGGTGKTTTVANLGYALSQQRCEGRKNAKLKVLLIDTDSQGNLSQNYNMDIQEEVNFYQAFINQEPLTNYILKTKYENIDMVVYHEDIIALEHQIVNLSFREMRMKNIIESVKEEGKYDYILVDCHPSLGYFNQSIIYGSDYVLVPLIPATFPMRGLQHFVAFMKRIQEEAKTSNVEILGVVFNKVDKVQALNNFIVDYVSRQFLDRAYIFKSKIPTDTTIDKAQWHCMPVGATNHEIGKGRSKHPYVTLAREVVKRTHE